MSKFLVKSNQTSLYISESAFFTSLSHRFHKVAQLDFSRELQQESVIRLPLFAIRECGYLVPTSSQLFSS